MPTATPESLSRGDLEAFWMPFTANRQFKSKPRILAKASHNKEEILIADLDPKLIEVTRQHWPFLRDRRIDAYEGIAKRFLD